MEAFKRIENFGGAERQSTSYLRDSKALLEVIRWVPYTYPTPGGWMKANTAVLAVAASALMAWGLGMGTVRAASQDAEAAKPDFYTTQVQPILQANCYRCHGGPNRRGGLSLATRESMLKGGHDGPVLVPGDPAKSLLVRLIRHEGPANDPMPMPPKSPKISDQDIATIERWVRAGAIMPEVTAAPNAK